MNPYTPHIKSRYDLVIDSILLGLKRILRNEYFTTRGAYKSKLSWLSDNNTSDIVLKWDAFLLTKM